MKLPPVQPIKGTKIDVAFIGSCTNGRLSDFREVAKFIKGRKVAPASKPSPFPAPRSSPMSSARQEGLDKIFSEAGFEWRAAGCSMCLAMNPDKLIGDQLCAAPPRTATSKAARAAPPAAPSSWTLEAQRVFFGDQNFTIAMPETAREALTTGQWDPIAGLLENQAAVSAKMKAFGWA
jgi:hypothetical protein